MVSTRKFLKILDQLRLSATEEELFLIDLLEYDVKKDKETVKFMLILLFILSVLALGYYAKC